MLPWAIDFILCVLVGLFIWRNGQACAQLDHARDAQLAALHTIAVEDGRHEAELAVLKDLHQAQLQGNLDWIKFWTKKYEAERDEYMRFVDKVIEMKRQGFEFKPPEVQVKQPLSTDLADEEAAMQEGVEGA